MEVCLLIDINVMGYFDAYACLLLYNLVKLNWDAENADKPQF
ncbi:MAG: hypothetical protein RLZZ597_951 [Cyanobacteriota bacterium]|jgi:hypothetical protein